MTHAANFHHAGLLAALATHIARLGRPRSEPRPRWVDDSEVTRQLMKDTGLAYEDLTGQRRYDERLPFFMQPGRWER